jgi:hypothetical protein
MNGCRIRIYRGTDGASLRFDVYDFQLNPVKPTPHYSEHFESNLTCAFIMLLTSF